MTDSTRPPMAPPRLIVNADDYGQSHGINEGVARAHRDGIVTSASLMVRWPSSAEAADYARDHPELSLGLHVDLGEWMYREGEWVPLYTVVDTEAVHDVERELKLQVEAFRNLAGRDPTHIDSHQHVHRSQALLPLFHTMAEETGAFLREGTHRVRYDGRFYGWDRHGEVVPGAVEVEALLGIIESLPPGVTELGCHPGLGNDMISPYRSERSVETETLCDPRIRTAVVQQGVTLASFHDIGHGEGG